jgi:hypothetical protein
VRSGVLVCVFGTAVTFQNISLGWVAGWMILCARTQSAAFYSGHSGQSPLVLNHIEPTTKIKWDQSREVGISSGNQALTRCAFEPKRLVTSSSGPGSPLRRQSPIFLPTIATIDN